MLDVFMPFNGIQNPESLANSNAEIAPIHIGIVTNVDAGTNSVFVRIPNLNQKSEFGPYPCLQPFTNQVETPVRQTLNVGTGTVDSTTVVTSVSLSSTTTNIAGVYGSLNLPGVGDRVLVVFVNFSIDDGVVVGKL